LIYSHEDAGIALKENVSDDARRFARISLTPLSKCLADQPLLDAFVPNDVEVFFDRRWLKIRRDGVELGVRCPCGARRKPLASFF
jgi:hypothetical protein